jgi:hypothetical protein
VAFALSTNSLISLFSGGGEDQSSKDLGSGRLFVMCGGITAVCALFCLFIVKETKGLSEKEVAALYSKESDDTKIDRTSYLQLDNGN